MIDEFFKVFLFDLETLMNLPKYFQILFSLIIQAGPHKLKQKWINLPDLHYFRDSL